MRSPAETNTWEYWIPGWNQALLWRDIFGGNLGSGISKKFGIVSGSATSDLEGQANSILGESRESYLEDRAHTEMREDTAYQRAVADMKAAGLNPFTIGASGAPSSSSSANSDYISNKLQVLGYILDLKNLDAKNRQITNQAIGNVLGLFKKK